MNQRRPSIFQRWPTGVILLLLLTAALLPLGLVLAWVANEGVRESNAAHIARADQQGLAAARAVESLIARNALALRIAGNAAVSGNRSNPCELATATLAVAPAVARQFRIRDEEGRPLCEVGDFPVERPDLLIAPGDIRLWISPQQMVLFRAGLSNGSATGVLNVAELKQAAQAASEGLRHLDVSDGRQEMTVLDLPAGVRPDDRSYERNYPISNGQLTVRTVTMIERTPLLDQLVMLVPLLMWLVAALLSWFIVRKILLNPLARLQRAVIEFNPGDEGLELPHDVGPTSEIRELCQAFERAVQRVEGAEKEALDALDGQRRLVREVHHRVKNNLQVVASLLSIHGRNTTKPEAKAAYSAIGRRVDALSVVHRHHYAELEENRGIALRPLITELVADLRSSAPPEAAAMPVELELDSPWTTQDAAVATSFLVTEIVEFAMLRRPKDMVEITLRRENELAASLAISSSVLVPESDPDDVAKVQFERIVEGLARQLRSPLDRKLGRYAVTLPIFPEN